SVPLRFFVSLHRPHPRSTLFPYTTLFRSSDDDDDGEFSDDSDNLFTLRRGLSEGEISKNTFEFTYQTPTVSSGGEKKVEERAAADRKSTRLNSSHVSISYAVFCLKKKTTH